MVRVGESHPNARLTWEKVREIRHRYATERISHLSLSAEYDVSVSVIGCVLRNETWKEPSEENA